MKVIYEPAGKAQEYAPWAVNLYEGCFHGCVYCYAPAATRKTVEQFSKVRPRVNILENLQADCFTGMLPDQVLLSFTSDAYQPAERHCKVTRQAIEILHKAGVGVNILTKGGSDAERDFDLLGGKDSFGVTLILIDPYESMKWEPYAALPEARMASLHKAHSLGIKTWVSFEPVINPEVTLELINQVHSFVDLIKVGKMNYHPIAKSVDWRKFGTEAVSLLDRLGVKYYIKNDLKST